MKYAVEEAKVFDPETGIKYHTEWVPADPKIGKIYAMYNEETDTITTT